LEKEISKDYAYNYLSIMCSMIFYFFSREIIISPTVGDIDRSLSNTFPINSFLKAHILPNIICKKFLDL